MIHHSPSNYLIMSRIISLLITLIITAVSFFADNNFSLADSLYKKGEYIDALQLYEQAVELEGTSAGMLFNMGNIAVKANRYGTAMVAYQKAASLDPGNSRIRHNIKYLSGKIEDRNNAKAGDKKNLVTYESPSALASAWIAITTHVSPDVWGGIALGSFLLLLAGIIFYVLSSNVIIRKIGFFTAIICLCLTVVFNIFVVSARKHWQTRNECVITAFESILKVNPDKDAKDNSTPLVAGTLMTMPETETEAPAGWVYVRLNSTTAGWIEQNDITIL